MKTLGQMLSSILAPDSALVSTAISKLQGLADVTPGSSALVQRINLARWLTAQTTASEVGASIVNVVEEIKDLCDEDDQMVSQTDIHEAFITLQKINDDKPAGKVIVGHVLGLPVELTYALPHAVLEDDDEYDVNLHRYRCAVRVRESDSTLKYFMRVIIPTDTYVPAWLMKPAYNSITVDGNLVDTQFTAILDSISTTCVNVSMLDDLFSRAQADGNIKVSQVYDVLSQYGPTDTVVMIKSMLAGSDVLSSMDIVAILSRVIATGDADYTEGDAYYTPRLVPEYNDNIIATLGAITIALVAVVLSAIFKVVGIIISMIGAVLSSFMSILSENITKTSPSIVRACDAPVWNYPLPAITPAEGGPRIAISNLFAEFGSKYPTLGLLRPVMKSGECVGHDPLMYWAFRTAPESYAVQPLIPACRYVPDSVANITFREGQTSSGYTYLVAHYFPGEQRMSQEYGSFPDPFDYVSKDERGLFEIMLSNLRYAAERASLDVDARVAFSVSALQDEPGSLNKPNIDHVLYAIDNLSFIGGGQMKPLFYYSNSPLFEAHPEYVVDSTSGRWNTDAIPTDQLNYIKVNLLVQVLRATYDNYHNLFTGNGDDPLNAWNGDSLRRLLTWEPFQYVIRDYAGGTASFNNILVFPGTQLLEPAVNFPEVSRSSVVTALVAAGLTAVAITVATVAVRHSLKKKAVARLALREAEFEKAKNAYLARPDDPVLVKKFNRANNRLNRAWTRAGSWGVGSYNGFSTTSTSTPVSQTGKTANFWSLSSDIIKSDESNALGFSGTKNAINASTNTTIDSIDQLSFALGERISTSVSDAQENILGAVADVARAITG